MDSKKEQFGLLYDQYIEKIYRFVYLKVDSRETAEDISSRVFMKGWEAYQQENRDIKNYGAFLYQIARNMVVDHYRQKGRTTTVSTDSIGLLADSKEDIHKKAIFNADMDRVKAAIRALKGEHQDVLIWYYLEDMDAEAIAKLIGKPPGTVRVIIHRGLEALRSQLHQES